MPKVVQTLAGCAMNGMEAGVHAVVIVVMVGSLATRAEEWEAAVGTNCQQEASR